MKSAGAIENSPPVHWWPGHHLGTTRMGADPKTSVVNANRQSHVLSHLYLVTTVAIVPGGVANRTLTLAGFALRAAGRIARAGRGQPAESDPRRNPA